MTNEEHLAILKQGVEVWNRWREKHPEIQPQLYSVDLDWYYFSLSRANLSNADLVEARLSELDLQGANLTGSQLRNADLRWADLTHARLYGADLRGADLTGADLSRANLQKAVLDGAILDETTFNRANLRAAYLVKVGLSGVSLNRANLRDANLGGADLYEAQLHNASFVGANLRKARLSRANLSEADFHKADLTGADLREAKLIGAQLDEATITDVCLWESQRAGWSIQGIICEAVYWDIGWQDRVIYSPGEFERLYADKMKVILHYKGGIVSPIEVATLPSMIETMQKWSGCTLRLDSLQDAPGGATVTLAIEDPGNRNTAQMEALKAELVRVGQQVIDIQRELLQEREGRLRAEGAINFVSNFFSPLMERAMGKSQEINVRGNVYGHIGQVSGGEYTLNDLTAIKNLIDEIFERRTELSLTYEKLADLEASIQTVQDQFAVQTPNHSIIREALRSVRNIIEGAIGSAIASGWLPMLQRFG